MSSSLFVDTGYIIAPWGLVDCLSFVVMKQHQISVVLSFDRHFIQAGFALAK